MEASEMNLADGEYTVEVTMEGGSGRASIQSPTELTIENGQAQAEIVWSSSHYDYMMVNGDKYLPVNTEGNSTFEIPVSVFDEPMTVIGDTTAMSVPHEVEYTLTFASESVASVQSNAYKLEAAAENPHCGNAPSSAPKNGPALPESLINLFVLLLVLCSRYSIARYVRNKNGNNLMLSNSVSAITSNILSTLLNIFLHIYIILYATVSYYKAKL